MKEVDQETGEDLNPQNTKRLMAIAAGEYSGGGGDYNGGPGTSSFSSMNAARNPDRPSNIVNADDDLFGQKVSFFYFLS